MIGAAIALSLIAAAFITYRLLRPTVTVTEVVEGPVVQAFYATGTLQPVREFPIKSQVAGTLAKVLVEKGDSVKAGQPLAVVTDPGLDFRQMQAEAEVREKRARAEAKTSPVLQEFEARAGFTVELLVIAQREEQRVTSLLKQNAASQSDLDRSLDRVKELSKELESLKAQLAAKKLEVRKDLEVAEAALKIANWNVEEQTLRSPTDGVVLDRPESMGTRLKENDHIMQIADVRPEKLVMRAAVDEEDLTNVRRNQLVRMTLYSFQDAAPFEGKVTRIYDKADPERRTFEVDVTIDRPNERLAAGMTGELAFIIEEKATSLVVPAQAWQNGAVYTVRGGRLEQLKTTRGLRSVERLELLDGVRPGDRVVISPVGNLKPGRSVRAEYLDPVAAANLNKPRQKEAFKGFN